MLNTKIENETDRHTQSVMYAYYMHEARPHTIEYLKKIKSVESYVRYGVEPTNISSLRKHRKILTGNGKIRNDIIRSSQY